MRTIMLTVLTLALTGCASEVGDSCETSTECGTELTCDLSQPGGYCTKTPCEVNGCPDEGVCIRFDDDSSYCMRRCEDNDDCRDDYVCEDQFGDAPFCSATHYLGEK